MDSPLCFVQGTIYKSGLSQGCESLQNKRLGSAHTTDSSGSIAFKRARTISSALLDLLPLASDASTLDARCISVLCLSCCGFTRQQRMCEIRVAVIRPQIVSLGDDHRRRKIGTMGYGGVARDCALPAFFGA